AYLGCGDLPGPPRRLQPACPVAVAIARGLALSALVTFAPKLVARFRLQHLLDDQPHREANQLRTVSLRPQPSIDERPKPLACLLRRRYSLHHGMLPEGFRRQPKARSPASLRQGASQTFFQQIYAFTRRIPAITNLPTNARCSAFLISGTSFPIFPLYWSEPWGCGNSVASEQVSFF